jgi:hypothetical protein
MRDGCGDDGARPWVTSPDLAGEVLSDQLVRTTDELFVAS